MELRSKKILFLGDSITEGIGVSSVDKTYWNVVAQRTGATCLGYGIGGTRIARQARPDPESPVDLMHFCTRVEKMDATADIVVVFGGVNDFGTGDAPLGCMNDRDDSTFYGALHVLCEKLINRFPTAQLIFMTPLHFTGEDAIGLNVRGNRVEHTLRDYVRIIREVTQFYSLPVLDLFQVSGIQPRVDIQRELFMPDGLHPNDAGAARIAEKLIAFLHNFN